MGILNSTMRTAILLLAAGLPPCLGYVGPPCTSDAGCPDFAQCWGGTNTCTCPPGTDLSGDTCEKSGPLGVVLAIMAVVLIIASLYYLVWACRMMKGVVKEKGCKPTAALTGTVFWLFSIVMVLLW